MSTRKGNASLGSHFLIECVCQGRESAHLTCQCGALECEGGIQEPSRSSGASWDPVMHTDLKIKASYEVNKALKGTEIFESDLDAPGDR